MLRSPATEVGRLTPAGADDVLGLVREARDRRTPLRLAGRGSWLDAGRPVTAAQLLSLAELSGILEYIPGDLTLTALAGTPLAEIARVTGAERQWLALDPHGSAEGTLGATIATASAGPLAGAFGTPRDAVLGLDVVTGVGDRIRTGGRVVKNVAGFDLTRLFTGSWGSIGVLLAATVRLRGMPEVDETVALRVPDGPRGGSGDGSAGLDALVRRLREAPLAPAALELVNGAAAAALGAGDSSTLLVRLAGNGELVAAQRATLGRFGETAPCAPGIWAALRDLEGRASTPLGAPAVFRLSRAPAAVGACWAEVTTAVRDVPGAMIHGSVTRGIVRAIVPLRSEADISGIARGARATGAAFVAERLPDVCWREVPGAAGDRLSRRVKEIFDPLGLFNPGILGGPE